MSTPILALRPELCDRCGKCAKACPLRRVTVGAGYVYIDVAGCDGCLACVDVCARGAIVTGRNAGADARPIVGSRAQAKALRQSQSEPKVKVKTQEKKQAIERSVEQRWAWVEALGLLSVLLLALVAKDALLGSQFVRVMPAGGKVIARIVVLALFYAAQVAALIVLARRAEQPFARAFRLVPRWPGAVAFLRGAGMVLGLLVLTRGVATGWGAIAQALGWSPGTSETLTTAFGLGNTGLVLTSLLVVLVAPVAEEIAFREVLLNAVGARLGRWITIALTAAIFSAYHLSWWVVLPTFVLGLALGWLAERSDTLWPPIILHALYNAVAVAGVFLLAR